jgi:hypothetical protein
MTRSDKSWTRQGPDSSLIQKTGEELDKTRAGQDKAGEIMRHTKGQTRYGPDKVRAGQGPIKRRAGQDKARTKAGEDKGHTIDGNKWAAEDPDQRKAGQEKSLAKQRGRTRVRQDNGVYGSIKTIVGGILGEGKGPGKTRSDQKGLDIS